MQRHLIAPLSSTRSILHLTGPEAPKFLQGLVTNDVIIASNPSKTVNAVYAGFLSAPGRVLHDTFILPCPPSSSSSSSPSTATAASPAVAAAPTSSAKRGPITAPPGTEYLIDFPVHSTSPPLPSYVKRYILRSKVKSKLVDDQWRLWAVFQDPLHAIQASRQHDELANPSGRLEEELQSIAGESKGKWWRDRRNRGMGYRLLLPESATAAIQASSSFTSSESTQHALLRTLLNVPEAPTDLLPNSALPLESNMDLMGGIDFRKGCYIGQELTARTYHTGVIRKRVMPVRVYLSSTEEVEAPSSLLPETWTSITGVEQLPPIDAEVRPSATTAAATPRRGARPLGKLGSVLRVTGNNTSGATEEAYLGLALLRLEGSDGQLQLGPPQSAADTDESQTEASSGSAAAAAESPFSNGQWCVKAFKESLEGAK